MNRNRRRWKNTADGALSPVDFAHEREQVALQIAACVAGRSSGDIFAMAALENRVLNLIEDTWVRAALAAQYLDTLHDTLRTADYEDRCSLDEEASWTATYLAPQLETLLSQPDYKLWITSPAREASCLSRLYDVLSDRVAPRVRIESAA